MVPIFENQSRLVRLAQTLFFLLAAAMAVFGLLTFFYGTPPVVAALMLVDALLLGLAGWLIPRRSNFFYWLSILLVLGNILATLADQFGWVDAIVLLTFVALLAALLAAHRQFEEIHHGGTEKMGGKEKERI